MVDPAAISEALNKALLELDPNGVWPVNLHKILLRLGIQLHFESVNGKGDAAYLQLGNRPTIIIYRDKPQLFVTAKERFSIAHELAHWVVWRRFGSIPSKDEYWCHEILCNEFAGRLLVSPRKLRRFLEQQHLEEVHPVYFPDKVARYANVSWDVAAISISAEPSVDSTYLRLVRRKDKETSSTARPKSQIELRVETSSLINKPGSFPGRSALVRAKPELIEWIIGMGDRHIEHRPVTLESGLLHLTDVPCTFWRGPGYWVIHFRRSDKGIQITT